MNSHNLTRRWSAALLLAAVSTACINDDREMASNNIDSIRTDSTMTASLPDEFAPFADAYDPLTDEVIARDLMTANSIDSAFGALAQRRAKSPDLRAYGEHMVRDHGKNNEELRALLTRQAITPRAGADSAARARDAEVVRAELDTTKAFDVAYIGRVTRMHRDLLQKLDSAMIPNARNTELKAHLVKTRPHVADHLKKAEDLQAKMPRNATLEAKRDRLP